MIKPIIMAIALGLASQVSLHAQYVYEYWFDDNVENRQEGSLSSGRNTLTIHTDNLSEGIHTLFFRTSDGASWSVPMTKIFVKPYITGSTSLDYYEYWIDGDYNTKRHGEIHADIVDTSADLSNLAQGLHTFTFRCRDSKGNWSAPLTKVFIRPFAVSESKITDYEYWIDNDIASKVTGQMEGGLFVSEFDLAEFSPGLHSLNFRCRDAKGDWSSPISKLIVIPRREIIPNLIEAYQYGFNGGNMKTVEFDEPANPYTLTTTLSIDNPITTILPENVAVIYTQDGGQRYAVNNTLAMRFRDCNGRWSDIYRDTIAVAIDYNAADFSGFIANNDARHGREGWEIGGQIGSLIQNLSHWSGEERPYFCLGDAGRNGWEAYMKQTVKGVPAGTYLLSAIGRAAPEAELSLCVNDISVSYPSLGAIGGEIWENSLPGSSEKNLNEGKGGGWNKRDITLTLDGSDFEILVTASSKKREQWADIIDFSLTPVSSSSVRAIFPEGVDMTPYKNMKLRLYSGDFVLTQTVGSGHSYLFSGISNSVTYNLELCNQYGHIIASHNNISIGYNETTSIELDRFKSLRDVDARVVSKDGTDFTRQTNIKWFDSKGNLLCSEKSLHKIPDDSKLIWIAELSDSLNRIYATPDTMSYIVSSDVTTQTVILKEHSKVTLKGRVIGSTGILSNASVSVSQLLNSSVPSTVVGQTDLDGRFCMEVINDSSAVTFKHSEHFDSTIYFRNFNDSTDLGNIRLRPVTGTVITPNLTYFSTVEHREDNQGNRINDLSNIDFMVRNVTNNRDSLDYHVKGSLLIVPDGIEAEDLIEIFISSRTKSFAPTSITAAVNTSDSAVINCSLYELGHIKVFYETSENDENIALIFDSKGRYLKRASYSGQEVEFDLLNEGTYNIVSLGRSELISAVADLNNLDRLGLVAGSDYIISMAEVSNGHITEIELPIIPELDDSSLYYTSESTSFSANKSSVALGQYVTLNTQIDFKEDYRGEIENLQLNIFLPDNAEYVTGSAIIGSLAAPCTVDEKGILSIPVNEEKLHERIRLCIVSVTEADMAINASVEFRYDGTDISQPIGSVVVSTSHTSLSVPETTRSAEIPVAGMTVPLSQVNIIDNGNMVGSVNAKADGSWATNVTLTDAYNLSHHKVNAEIVTPAQMRLSTESRDVMVNISANGVKSVTMLNTAHTAANLNLYEYKTVFDFQNPSTEAPVYWYWPSYPDFTFIIDFIDNEPMHLSDVLLGVRTSTDEIIEIPATFNEETGKWVATRKFTSSCLPVNIEVNYRPINEQFFIDKTNYDKPWDTLIDTSDYCHSLDSLLSSLIREQRTLINQAVNKEITIEDFQMLQDSLVGSYDFMNNSINMDIENEWIEKIQTLVNQDDETLKFKYEMLKEEYLRQIGFSTEDLNICQSFNPDLENWDSLQNVIFDKVSVISEPITIIDTNDLVSKGFIEFEDQNGNKYYCLITESIITLIDITENIRSSLSLGDFVYRQQTGTKIKEKFDLLETGQEIASKIDTYLKFDESFGEAALFEMRQKQVDNLINNSPNIYEYQSKIDAFEEDLKNTNKKKAKLGWFSKLMEGLSLALDLKDSFDKWTEGERLKHQIIDCFGEEVYWSQYDYKIGELEAIYNYIKLARYGGSKLLNKAIEYLYRPDIVLASCGGSMIVAKIWEHNISQLEQIVDIMNTSMFDDRYANLVNSIDWSKCRKKPNISSKKEISQSKDAQFVQDPSGYVYEAVTSNRLEGVTATVYQKTVKNDMYGDPYEEIIRWNADAYSQRNPQITDHSGVYAWDVPEGLWQVRFEKPGYETAMTPWLPVPPPQLDINIPMSHAVSPHVINADGYESGITITFDKYMTPSSFSTDSISVMKDDLKVEGTIEMVNLEEDPYSLKSYASKVKFVPNKSFTVGDKVFISLKKGVMSYASKPMDEDYQVTVIIKPEIKSIVADSIYTVESGEEIAVPIIIEPGAAARGKRLNISNSSSVIAMVDSSSVVINREGIATINVRGILRGTSVLSLSVEDSDVKTELRINVCDAINRVAAPRASIASGSVVAKGTLLTLASSTDSAKIYYTVDGTCPCNESTRILYTEPITLNEDITIKAQAEREGMENSKITILNYIINDSGIDNVTYDYENISSDGNNLNINNYSGWYCEISNLLGQIVHARKLSADSFRLSLKKDEIYIVKLTGQDGKVVVSKVII